MNVKSKVDRSAMLELDIRGCSSDEGIHQLESFIDNAVMSNIGTVTIIHKGTGVLRSAIQKRLKKCHLLNHSDMVFTVKVKMVLQLLN